MNKRILILGLLALATTTYAAQDFFANKSSNTSTADTTKTVGNVFPGDILVGVVINRRSGGTAETLKLWDSSGTIQTSTITSNMDLSSATSASYVPFNLRVSSGIVYTKSGSQADITILWTSQRNQ